MSDKNDYVVFDHVRKVYHVGEVDIEALADATFSVAKGELAIVVGESGAGKTTLLNILGGMDTLTSGKVLLDGREISSLSMRELTKYRRYDIGFVFQFYNLVQNLTALENVSLATQICKDPLDPAESSREENSRGWQSRELSPRTLNCFSAMSLPVPWTTIQVNRYCSCCRTRRTTQALQSS